MEVYIEHLCRWFACMNKFGNRSVTTVMCGAQAVVNSWQRHCWLANVPNAWIASRTRRPPCSAASSTNFSVIWRTSAQIACYGIVAVVSQSGIPGSRAGREFKAGLEMASNFKTLKSPWRFGKWKGLEKFGIWLESSESRLQLDGI